MSCFKDNIKSFLWKRWMLQGKRGLKENNLFAQKIIKAIDDTLHPNINPQEEQKLRSIEGVRKQFTNNPTSISVTDFGAGNPNESRSQEKMQEGLNHFSTYGAVALGSKPELWASLLFNLVRQFKPKVGIELGSCIGISAAYEATAMELNQIGKLYTLEGSPSIAKLAKENLESLNLSRAEVVIGRFCDTLLDILKENTPINYVFIDGHHDEQATWGYYQLLLPFLSPNALLIFDDISWSKGMKRVWERIKSDKHVSFYADMKMIGLCIVNQQEGC
jgi:Predicted O-methyltransferase